MRVRHTLILPSLVCCCLALTAGLIQHTAVFIFSCGDVAQHQRESVSYKIIFWITLVSYNDQAGKGVPFHLEFFSEDG
jgi:hypothetical protein